jgi:putative transposase
MGSRSIDFTDDEYYHIFNRGTERRDITLDPLDSGRFILSLEKFNHVQPIGSIYETSFAKDSNTNTDSPERLVEIIAFCLNPNHFHLLLRQVSENGIIKFLHRLCTGYSKYFNARYKRKGVLFQGKFGAAHITDNEYLLHASAYVNLNDRVHQLGRSSSKLVRSSWSYYLDPSSAPTWMDSAVILEQFTNSQEYEKFAIDALELMLEHKMDMRELDLTDGLE